MSGTISLTARLQDQANLHLQHGRFALALKPLLALTRMETLPPDQAALTHAQLAGAYRKLGLAAKARRHYVVALTYHPKHAEWHHQLATLLDEAPEAIRRALHHHQAAAKHAPGEARYAHAFGQALIRAGQRKRGLGQLAKAAELAPHDFTYLRAYTAALIAQERVADAERVLVTSQFRFGASPVFQRLRHDMMFNLARFQQTQWAQRQATEDDSPAILPFPAKAIITHDDDPDHEGTVLRLDAASKARPHLNRHRRRAWNNG